MAAMAAAPPSLVSRRSHTPLPSTKNTFLHGSRSVWSTRHCLLGSPPGGGASRRRAALAVRASSVSAAAAAAAPVAVMEEKTVQRLKLIYVDKVVPALLQEFKYSNKFEVPRVEKVVINCGSGEAAQNAKLFEGATKDISTVAGQRPVVTRARKAIAGFKIRKGMPVGLALTLRGELMYSFLDRLLNLALPRTRDFLGVNPNSFDGKGNFNLGLRELTVFPEIKFDNIDKARGMDVCIVTSAKTDKEGQKLLSLLGLPFREGGITKVRVVKKKTGRYFAKGGKRK